MSPVLVVGGAGRTGRRITDRLLGRGDQVRVASRTPQRQPWPSGVETCAVDLRDPSRAADVVRGTAGVVVSVEPPYDPAGAEAVLHRGVGALAAAAADAGVPFVLVSQIYVTRPEAYPQMAEVTRARGRGEQALRDSGAPYTIVRPGWLTDERADRMRLEQGDTGDGPVARDLVAEACVQALLAPDARGRTFEVFDGTDPVPASWAGIFAGLTPDTAGTSA